MSGTLIKQGIPKQNTLQMNSFVEVVCNAAIKNFSRETLQNVS